MKYRTRPVEVEAIGVDQVLANPADLPFWLRDAVDSDQVWSITAEGVNLGDFGRGYVIAQPGEWLAYHGCFPNGNADIRRLTAAEFVAGYEPVE
jgi:hypothetical protein